MWQLDPQRRLSGVNGCLRRRVCNQCPRLPRNNNERGAYGQWDAAAVQGIPKRPYDYRLRKQDATCSALWASANPIDANAVQSAARAANLAGQQGCRDKDCSVCPTDL